jgi:hypothetical protein
MRKLNDSLMFQARQKFLHFGGGSAERDHRSQAAALL